MLRNVIFDFGGVVCEYNTDDIVRRFFDEADCAQAKAAVYRDWAALDAGTADYPAYAAETGRLLPERLAENVRRFFRDWYVTLPAIEDNWALIARLKARGFGVFLLSNAPTAFAEGMDCIPILRAMDGRLISASERLVKPDAAIYRLALERFGIRAEETLFIDDTPANVEGAIRSKARFAAACSDTSSMETPRLSPAASRN